jgi:hypothetical protein
MLLKLLNRVINRKTVADKLPTGYRTTGIKTARPLHRLLFGTGDVSLLMCEKLCRKFFFKSDCSTEFYSSNYNSMLAKSAEATRSVGLTHSSADNW